MTNSYNLFVTRVGISAHGLVGGSVKQANRRERGFKHLSGNIVEGATNKSAMLVSPSGFGFDLCQHIKD